MFHIHISLHSEQRNGVGETTECKFGLHQQEAKLAMFNMVLGIQIQGLESFNFP